MMLFDKDGIIKHYESPEHIIQEFYELRLEYYEKRRLAMLQVCAHRRHRLVTSPSCCWMPCRAGIRTLWLRGTLAADSTSRAVHAPNSNAPYLAPTHCNYPCPQGVPRIGV